MENYLYINERLVNQYYDMLQDTLPKPSYKKAIKLSIPTFFEASFSDTEKGKEQSCYHKIKTIEEAFRAENLISNTRLSEMSTRLCDSDGSEENKKFFQEKCSATKVVIPTGANFKFPHIKYITVWVSEPDPTLYSDVSFIWRGTFLYLVTIETEHEREQTIFSGVSALQALSNLVTGEPFLSRHKDGGEPLGRWNGIHPLEKLKTLGAEISYEREITTLYKKHYFTNEQSHTYEGKERRVNDLLAYPLWIKEV